MQRNKVMNALYSTPHTCQNCSKMPLPPPDTPPPHPRLRCGLVMRIHINLCLSLLPPYTSKARQAYPHRARNNPNRQKITQQRKAQLTHTNHTQVREAEKSRKKKYNNKHKKKSGEGRIWALKASVTIVTSLELQGKTSSRKNYFTTKNENKMMQYRY